MKLDFQKWFKAQFGKRPTGNRTLVNIMNEIGEHEHDLRKLRNLYDKQVAWDMCRNAALMSRNATENPDDEFLSKGR